MFVFLCFLSVCLFTLFIHHTCCLLEAPSGDPVEGRLHPGVDLVLGARVFCLLICLLLMFRHLHAYVMLLFVLLFVFLCCLLR